MIRQPRSLTLNSGPELTPLIDIVFIVVVFLLLTANAHVMSLPVDIPDTDSKLDAPSARKQTFTVAVKSTSPYWVIDIEGSGTSHYEDWQDFKDAVIDQLALGETALTIAPDANASVEKLLKLLALLNEEAFSDVQILMEDEK